MIDREELERLHEAAIPGPWRAEKIKGHDDFTQILHTKKDGKIGCVSADINDADGELTAHLRNAVPDILTLLTERDTLAAENARLYSLAKSNNDLARIYSEDLRLRKAENATLTAKVERLETIIAGTSK